MWRSLSLPLSDFQREPYIAIWDKTDSFFYKKVGTLHKTVNNKKLNKLISYPLIFLSEWNRQIEIDYIDV